MDSVPLDLMEAALVAAAVIALIVGVKWFRGSARLPPQKTFRCARCSSVEAYSHRTIEAWRAGKAKLFCRSCHAQWLQSQPSRGRLARPSNSGCLGVLILAAAIPTLVLCTTLRPLDGSSEQIQRDILSGRLPRAGDKVKLLSANGAELELRIVDVNLDQGVVLNTAFIRVCHPSS